MSQNFLRIKQLASKKNQYGRIPLSASSIWRLVRLEQFPRPVKLSIKCTAWRVQDIETWESQRKEIT